jgi:uncharacterized Zn finger protein
MSDMWWGKCPICEDVGIDMHEVVRKLGEEHFPGIPDVTEEALRQLVGQTGKPISTVTTCKDCGFTVEVTIREHSVFMTGPSSS